MEILKKLIILTLILVNINIPIAFADDEDDEIINLQEIIEASSSVVNEIKLNARYVAVMDRKTGAVLYEKNSGTLVPMASTTKILTAVVVLEKANIDDVVTVSKKAASVGGSRTGLKTGDKIKVNDLLYGLMLCSGNDSAIALAEFVGGSVERIC